MSYHFLPRRVAAPARIMVLGGMPPMTPTTLFAEAVDPYAQRFSPPGAIYAPYGWGPDFNIGMPFNYTHHLSYERVPVAGARRIGPYYDVLSGSWNGGAEASMQALNGILAVV